ncbi:hypothetical protein G6F61_014771 [Rhizopus arrhizus]|nr:hypothetical protein G6F61_014771 [Rhizopus arrhizus]
METNALDDAKTKVNVDHNQAGNGNKVDLRKRGIDVIPVVDHNIVSALDDAKTKVNVDHNQAGNGNKVELRKRD